MNCLKTFFITLSCCNIISQSVSDISKPSIIILCTSALIPLHYNERKQEYIESLTILQKQPLPFYITESCLNSGPSFLNDYCDSIFYTGTNNPNLRNKGVNEAIAMKAALDYFNFDDETMIIKLTGRYKFRDFSFLNTLIKNYNNYDAFVKYDHYGQVITGCFAMRCKFMKNMLENLDLKHMEMSMINLELMIAQYLERNIPQDRISSLSSLGVTARIFGDGTKTVIEEW